MGPNGVVLGTESEIRISPWAKGIGQDAEYFAVQKDYLELDLVASSAMHDYAR